MTESSRPEQATDIDLLRLENQLCFPLYATSRLVTRLYQPLLEPLGRLGHELHQPRGACAALDLSRHHIGSESAFCIGHGAQHIGIHPVLIGGCIKCCVQVLRYGEFDGRRYGALAFWATPSGQCVQINAACGKLKEVHSAPLWQVACCLPLSQTAPPPSPSGIYADYLGLYVYLNALAASDGLL